MSETRDELDKQIVNRVLSGDRNAFRGLVDRYQGPVRALGWRMLRNEERVADYVQDVFVKAFTRLNSFSGTGRFYSWLMRIAYTTACNAKGRRPPEQAMDPGDMTRFPGRSDSGPEEHMLRREADRALQGAIAELPSHYGLAVELFFRLGLGYKEIEETTGIPINTMKSYVFRARKRLREALSDTTAEDYYEMRSGTRTSPHTG
jgi:RNA polymerase sigma-70 factor (ECF subfamily)